MLRGRRFNSVGSFPLVFGASIIAFLYKRLVVPMRKSTVGSRSGSAQYDA
jgi:hypothetical protein